MKAYLNAEYYADINLNTMELVVKKIKGEKAISMSPLRKTMTLEELNDFIEMQKEFLKDK